MIPDRFWLTDAQFSKIAPHLPTDTRGRARVDDRRVISGIVHVLKSGGRWIDAPPEYGPKKTLYNRYVRWAAKGVWVELESGGAMPNIPPKANRKWKNCFSPFLYRNRNAIERMFCRLKDFRRIATRYDRNAANFLAAVWRFDQTTTRMPEVAAPGLVRESNHVVLDAELSANASGVLYALGGASGGLTLYLDHGRLFYEYNMMIIERYIGQSKETSSAGKHMIEVDTTIARPGGAAVVVLKVDGAEVGQLDVKRTVAGAFTASETLDVGVDLGSPVSLDYFDRRPFAFNGKINSVTVELK